MDEERQRQKEQCLRLCEKLLADLKRNKEDADEFFGGDMYKAYVNATDAAISKVKLARNRLRNL